MSELTEKLVRYVRSIPFADNEAGHPEIAQAMREAAAEITRLETELAEVKDTIRAFEEVHIPLLKHEIDILKGEHQTWSSGGTDEAAGLRLNAVDEPGSGECNSTAISGRRRHCDAGQTNWRIH